MGRTDPRSGGRECAYCNVKQPDVIHIKDMKDDYHMCTVTGLMTPFIPVGRKDKKRKFDNEPATENVPMRSWGETPGAYDSMMGGPTRGRR